MTEEIQEIIDLLEDLLEDSPYKIKKEILIAINMLKKSSTTTDYINVQEQLEDIANMNNIDTFISTELYNVISNLESLM